MSTLHIVKICLQLFIEVSVLIWQQFQVNMYVQAEVCLPLANKSGLSHYNSWLNILLLGNYCHFNYIIIYTYCGLVVKPLVEHYTVGLVYFSYGFYFRKLACMHTKIKSKQKFLCYTSYTVCMRTICIQKLNPIVNLK